MTRAIRFLVMTVVITIVLGGLFLVLVCAPEPWQTRPWTVWERCASFLFLVLGWPIWLAGLVIHRLPDWLAGPLFVFLFVLSGAFWSGVIEVVRTVIKRTPNKALHATAAAPGS
jgi:hypothetical protein